MNKVMAYILDVNYGSNGAMFDVKIQDAANSDQTSYGPVSLDVAELTLNADLKAFARDYAITNFGTTFDVGDTVRLINHIGG